MCNNMIYDYKVKNPQGKEVSLNTYGDKVLLIVNTAVHCGLAPQYEGLETLYKTYHDKGFEILDFPCNQFANQSPESNEEIGKICEMNFLTTFPRFAKLKVNGKNADPLYKYLKKSSPSELNGKLKRENLFSKLIFGKRIKWNFTKFLINRNGDILQRFAPTVKPENIEKFIQEII